MLQGVTWYGTESHMLLSAKWRGLRPLTAPTATPARRLPALRTLPWLRRWRPPG